MRQASWGPLRFRVPALVVTLFLLLAALLVRGMRYAETRSYLAVERTRVANDVRRASAALDMQEDALRALAGELGPRPDTRAFMDGYSEEYARSNLSTAALEALDLDFMAFVDAAGRLVRIGTVRPDLAGPASVRALEAVAAFVPTDGPAVYSGKMLLPEGPAIVAVTPIGGGARSSSRRGTLVVGRVLGARDVARLEAVTLMDIQVRAPRADKGVSTDRTGHIYVQPIDQRTVTGRLTVAGLDRRPAVRMLVTEKRGEYVNAMATLDYAGVAIVGLVVLFGLGIYVVLDLMVLGRLTQLHRELSAIGRAPSSPRRVSVRGHDEISEVGTAVNVTLERLEVAEEALRHAAHHDYLTDLENRRGFEREAVRELAERSRTGGHCALVLLDIDEFKLVNDSYGHLMGDRVLVQFAQILRASMRSYSTVARLGGDEFAVLLPHADRDEAMVALGRLNEALSSAVWEGADATTRVRATAGVAVSPADGETLDELVAAADSMLYAWKSEKQEDAPDE